jgi:chemotaxis signal transduction protein/nucleoid-associated protein YgaU
MRAIYLLTFSDHHYAVWKDEVESVRKVETIHRLPFSPACIAGLAFIDKQSTALADLAVLIGLPPLDRNSQAQLMLIAGQKKDAGFVVSGDIVEISIPAESIQPMPAYIATPEISHCIIYQEKPVPLIDLQALYQHIHSRDLNPSIPTLPVPENHPPSSGITSIRVLTAGGEVFALPADMVGETSDKPISISTVPLTPESLKGIIAEGNTVTPVIDLAEKMNLPTRGSAEKLLIVKIGGDNFGFLVDSDLGTFSENDFSLHQLPTLAKSSLISATAIHDQEIIPIVDPIAIIDPEPAKLNDIALADQYRLDSDFSGRFNHEKVEIVEFMLLGERHALPKTEVEDILPIATFRRIPDLQSLVIGIIEFRGEILPVLDLALVFGRRSLITDAWQMVLINNGDFRALIVTEAIYPERSLPLNIQKKVPISLPNRLVYGCYPDGNIVRLIVNVATLAVHFDKMVVKNFLASLTKEMAEKAAEIVPDLLPAEEVLRLEKEARLKKIAEQQQTENAEQAKTGEESPEPEEEAGTSQESKPEEPAQAEDSRQAETETTEPQNMEQTYLADELPVLSQPQVSSLEKASDELTDEPAESIELPKLLSDGILPGNEQEFDDIIGNEEQLTKSLSDKLDQLDGVEKVGFRQSAESDSENKISSDTTRQVAVKKLLEQEKQASSKAEEKHLKLTAEIEQEKARTREILDQQERDAQNLAIAKEERLKQEEEQNIQKLTAEVEKERARTREIQEQHKRDVQALARAREERLKQEEEQSIQKLAVAAEKERARTREILAQQERDAQALAIAKEERLKREEELHKKRLATEAEEERSRLREILAQQKQKEVLRGTEEAEHQAEAQVPSHGLESQQGIEEAMPAGSAGETTKIGHEQHISKAEKERIQILAEFRDQKKHNKKVNKPLLVLLFLLLVLISIFIFFDTAPKKQPVPPNDENALREKITVGHIEKTMPAVITKDVQKKMKLPTKQTSIPRPASTPEPASAPKPTSAPKLSPPKKEAPPPLIIIVPKNIPLAAHIYKVQRGDTLWDISMRFTGNPYNYPSVAQENDINNPDLIYPEQHILLKRADEQ